MGRPFSISTEVDCFVFFLTKGRKEPVVGIFLWGNIFRGILNKTKIVFYYTYFEKFLIFKEENGEFILLQYEKHEY